MTVLLKVDHGDEEGRDDDQDHRGKGQTYPSSNVADIENIEVLKDGSATTHYNYQSGLILKPLI